jgi:hypothetical protein
LRVPGQLQRDRLRNFLGTDHAHLPRWLMRNGRRRSRLGGSHLPFQKNQRYYQDGCHPQEEESVFFLPGLSGNRFLGGFSCLIVRRRIHVGVQGASWAPIAKGWRVNPFSYRNSARLCQGFLFITPRSRDPRVPPAKAHRLKRVFFSGRA